MESMIKTYNSQSHPKNITGFSVPSSRTSWGPREEINVNDMKKVQLILSISLCGFGVLLLVAGFVTPPVGEIHHSLLIAFGEILTFSGSLIGIDYKYRYKE